VQAAIVPVLKKTIAPFYNYRPIGVLDALSKNFELIIHDHVSQFLKSELNSSRHGIT
jgi:hypothetical protein